MLQTCPQGCIAKLAGYTNEELSALPPEAITNSFGCGNPLAFAGVKEGQTVLDLGSGAGIDLLLAAKKVGPNGRVIGVDMTDEMLAKAKENIQAAGLSNVDIRKGIIESLPVADASVDWVISNCVINLSPEKERVFKEIARVLKPGGALQVSDIVARNLPDSIKTDRRVYSSCLGGAISEESYIEGLKRAGLEDVTVKDRIVYDACQLKVFIESELKEATGTRAYCGSQTSSSIAQQLQGSVWSIKIYARKLD